MASRGDPVAEAGFCRFVFFAALTDRRDVIGFEILRVI
jgi:hypothetical protein